MRDREIALAIITGRQIVAARAIAGITQRELAAASRRRGLFYRNAQTTKNGELDGYSNNQEKRCKPVD